MNRSGLRRIFAPLRAADLYSSYAAPVLVGISAIICFEAFFALESVELWQPLVAGLASGLLVVGLLFAVDAGPRWNRIEEPTPIARLIGLVAGVALARGLVANALMWLFADVSMVDIDFVVRLISGATQMIFWILVTSLVISRIREQLNQQSVLLATQSAQLAVQRESADRLKNEAGEFRDTVQRRIVPALWQIHGQLSQLAQRTSNVDAGELAAQVRAICDVEVRQVSHLLASRSDEVTTELELPPRNSAAWALRKSLSRPQFYPSWSLVVALLMTLPIAVYRGGLAGLIGVVPGIFVIYAVGHLIDRFPFGWFRQTGWRLFVAQLGEVLLFAALSGLTIFASAIADDYPRLALQLLWMIPLNIVIVWFLMNIFFGSIKQLESVTSEVEAANKQLNQTIDGLEREHRQLRLTRAQLLHGPVQGRLAAVSLALTMHAQNSSQELVDSARDQLDEARRELVEALRAPMRQSTAVQENPLRDLLVEAAEQWNGLLDVEFEIAPECEATLIEDVRMTEAIVEAARECLVNSVRHGRARNAHMQLRCERIDGVRKFILDVNDDGRVNPVAAALSGFGGTSLRASGASREITPVDGGTRVRIVWPA